MLSGLVKRLIEVGLAVGFVGGAISTASAACSSSVSDWNTVDYIGFYATEDDVIDFSVSASGRGSNKLTVKVQQRKAGGSWVNIYSSSVEPGDTLHGSFIVRDYFSGSTEQLQFKLSRDLGTKEIEYDLCF